MREYLDIYSMSNIFGDTNVKMLRKFEEDVFDFFVTRNESNFIEEREQQQDMALDIASAIGDKKHLVVEAAVGTGKTYAYIVPALMYLKYNHCAVVIATSNIALQEQLEMDIQNIMPRIGKKANVLFVKGQTHYLCEKRVRKRLIDLKKEEYQGLEGSLNLVLSSNVKEKNDFISLDQNSISWTEINVSNFNKKQCSRCEYRESCKYYGLRIDLENFRGIVVCNQNFLAAATINESKLRKNLLPSNTKMVIVDEAHNFESKVRDSLMSEYSLNEVLRIINFSTDYDLLTQGESNVKKLFNYFSIVVANCYVESKNDRFMNTDRIQFDCNGVVELFKSIYSILKSIYAEKDSQSVLYENRFKEFTLTKQLEDIENLLDFLSQIINLSCLFWLESKNIKKNNSNNIKLVSCPKNIGDTLNNGLYNKSITIFTSATMTTKSCGSDFERYQYFIDNVSLNPQELDIAEPKDSPFEIEENTMIYYSDDLPHPTRNADQFDIEAVKIVRKLINISNGKTMILFTSKIDMEYVYEELVKYENGFTIYKQGNGKQADLISDFKLETNSVLLGVGTYWEGISIEGETLSNLIIYKLPFPVPDPIIDYKRKVATDPLMDVIVPEMILKLKQGIGRLIRNKTDKGIVSIVDPRLGSASSSKYRDIVWDAISIKNKTSDINILNDFYKKLFK